MSARCLAAAAGVLPVALALAGTAHASPQEVLGFGFRSMAMGTTGAAVGQGVDTVYANPALLSAERSLALQVGLMGASFGFDVEGAELPPLPSYPSFRAITIGGVLPLPFGGILKDRVALGIGFVTPLEIVVRGRILYPEKPQFLLADRVQAIAVQAALGIDLGYGIRIGGGFAASAALTGSVLVAEDASGRIGTNVEDTLIATYAPIVGASYDIGDEFRVGAAFRGELDGVFNVVITATDLGELTIPPLNIGGVAQYDPWQVAAEFARVSGDLRFGIGVTYKHWPAYPGPAEATVRCEEEQKCAALVPEDPEYNPVVAPRAGVEYRIPLRPVTLALRGGYAFEPSPAPEQTGRTSYLDNHRSIFSAGYGVDLTEPIDFSFDGMIGVHVLHARDHEKSVADGALAGGTVETSGAIIEGGTAITVRF
jgi:long-subunit fatty acid transport protein